MKNLPKTKTKFKIGDCFTFTDYPVSATLIGYRVIQEDDEIYPLFEIMVLDLLNPARTKMVWVEMEWFAKMDFLIKNNKAKILY